MHTAGDAQLPRLVAASAASVVARAACGRCAKEYGSGPAGKSSRRSIYARNTTEAFAATAAGLPCRGRAGMRRKSTAPSASAAQSILGYSVPLLVLPLIIG